MSPTEPAVLMFCGIGAGKTWLLKKLWQEMPAGLLQRISTSIRSPPGRGHRLVISGAPSRRSV